MACCISVRAFITTRRALHSRLGFAMNSSCPAGCTGMLSTLSPGEYAGIVPGKKVDLGLKGVVVLCKWCDVSHASHFCTNECPKTCGWHGGPKAWRCDRWEVPKEESTGQPSQSSRDTFSCPTSWNVLLFLTLCTLMRMARQKLIGMCTTLLTLCFVMRILRGRRTIRG